MSDQSVKIVERVRKRKVDQCNTAKLTQPRSNRAAPRHQNEADEKRCNIDTVPQLYSVKHVSRFGPAVRRQDIKQKDLGSIQLRLSFLFKKVVVCGHYLVTLSLTINQTVKWFSSLPILMQESLWW